VEIEKLKYCALDQFHMLRHFEIIDPVRIEKIIHMGFDANQIDEQLNLLGSRFFAEFATDIPTILVLTTKYGYATVEGLNGNIVLSISVPKTDFPFGIGSNAVVAISELTNIQKSEIYFQLNRGAHLLHLKVLEYPKTSTYTVVIKKKLDEYHFITAFPGEPGMPIPNEGMDQNLHQKCLEYWSNHVFLIKNNTHE
jgi:hypothetical protein